MVPEQFFSTGGFSCHSTWGVVWVKLEQSHWVTSTLATPLAAFTNVSDTSVDAGLSLFALSTVYRCPSVAVLQNISVLWGTVGCLNFWGPLRPNSLISPICGCDYVGGVC